VLVIRVWKENRAPLRARLTHILDSGSGEEATAVAETVDGVCAAVRAWLGVFAGAAE
jgi:hypothetical protein